MTRTLVALRERELVRTSREGGRVYKHAHLLRQALGLDGAELAVLSVLFLRGPQTSGELRTRTERQHPSQRSTTWRRCSSGSRAASRRSQRSSSAAPVRRSHAGHTCSGARSQPSRAPRPVPDSFVVRYTGPLPLQEICPGIRGRRSRLFRARRPPRRARRPPRRARRSPRRARRPAHARRDVRGASVTAEPPARPAP